MIKVLAGVGLGYAVIEVGLRLVARRVIARGISEVEDYLKETANIEEQIQGED